MGPAPPSQEEEATTDAARGPGHYAAKVLQPARAAPCRRTGRTSSLADVPLSLPVATENPDSHSPGPSSIETSVEIEISRALTASPVGASSSLAPRPLAPPDFDLAPPGTLHEPPRASAPRRAASSDSLLTTTSSTTGWSVKSRARDFRLPAFRSPPRQIEGAASMAPRSSARRAPSSLGNETKSAARRAGFR